MKLSARFASLSAAWLPRACAIALLIALPVCAFAADATYPDQPGVYAMDDGTPTMLYNGYLGHTAEETKTRSTLSPAVTILVVADSPAALAATTGTTAIYDWVSLGFHPQARVPIDSQPVEGHPNMLLLAPKKPLAPGLYSVAIDKSASIGDLALESSKTTPDYQFGVQTDDLAAYWTRVLTLKPDSWQAHNHLGAVLYMDGKVKESLVHFSKAIEINPKNPESHNNVGLALAVLKNTGGAIDQFEIADGIVKDSAIETNLANTYAAAKRYDDAIRMYRSAIKLQPSNASAHCNLGYVLMQQGNVDGAIPEFQEAVRLDPNMPQPKSDLEEALKKKGGGTGP